MENNIIYVGDCHNILEMCYEYIDCQKTNPVVLSDPNCIFAILNSCYEFDKLIVTIINSSDDVSEELRYETYAALNHVENYCEILTMNFNGLYNCWKEVTEIVKTCSNIIISLSQNNIPLEELDNFDEYLEPEVDY